MTGPLPLFALNPSLDRPGLARAYSQTGRIAIRNVLTDETAGTIRRILEQATPWGLAWKAAGTEPANVRAEALRGLSIEERRGIGEQVGRSAAEGRYAFLYSQYPMLTAYLEGWQSGHPLELLLEHINDQPLLELVRHVTGRSDLIKADAQATLYGPGHFLSLHDDHQEEENRRVAYVFSFAREWRPDWGGYLLFFDEEGDVVAGFRPRFNTLMLFSVPQRHNVSYVPPFAPVGRFALTGWFRDK